MFPYSLGRDLSQLGPLADPGFSFGGRSSAEGASIEAPQAPCGVGFGELGVYICFFLPRNGAFCLHSDA